MICSQVIDQKASIEPQELNELVKELRDANYSLGNPIKFQTDEEIDTAIALRRSIVAERDLDAGYVLDDSMVIMKRPGDGLHPGMLQSLIGKKIKNKVLKDEKILLDHFI
mgnify:CR=1 FL=1